MKQFILTPAEGHYVDKMSCFDDFGTIAREFAINS